MARREELKGRLTERYIGKQKESRRTRLQEVRRETGDGCHTSVFRDDEWASFGAEAGLDITDPNTVEYLLQLEEEIRREQCFELYEVTHTEDLEEYYLSLTS